MIPPFDIFWYRTERVLHNCKWYRKWRGGKWFQWWIGTPCGFIMWERSWKRPGLGEDGHNFESYPQIDPKFCEICQRMRPDFRLSFAIDFGIQMCEICMYDISSFNRKKW